MKTERPRIVSAEKKFEFEIGQLVVPGDAPKGSSPYVVVGRRVIYDVVQVNTTNVQVDQCEEDLEATES